MAFFSETQIILNLLKEQLHNGAILKKSPERRSIDKETKKR